MWFKKLFVGHLEVLLNTLQTPFECVIIAQTCLAQFYSVLSCLADRTIQRNSEGLLELLLAILEVVREL